MTGNNRSSTAGRLAKGQLPKRQRSSRQRKGARQPRVTRQVGKLINSMTALTLMESNSNVRPMNNSFTRMSGSDFLGNLSVKKSTATAAGKILRTLPVSPNALVGTRLEQLAGLWERYRFRKFRVRYVPAVPNTLGCQLICYQDTDPQDDPTTITDADALLRQATAQTGSQQWNFNSSKVIHLAQRGDKELYYTGPVKENPRFNLQGVVYILQVTDPVNFNGGAIEGDELQAGSLYVDWEIDFQTPQINPTAVAAAPPATPDFEIKSVGVHDYISVPAGQSVGVIDADVKFQGASVKIMLSGHIQHNLVSATADLVEVKALPVQTEDHAYQLTTDGLDLFQVDLVFYKP